MRREPTSRTNVRGLRVMVTLSTVGLTMALSVVVGIGLGMLLDRWFHTSWLVIVFALIGTVAGFKQLFQTVMRFSREEELEELERSSSSGADEGEENAGKAA